MELLVLRSNAHTMFSKIETLQVGKGMFFVRFVEKDTWKQASQNLVTAVALRW